MHRGGSRVSLFSPGLWLPRPEPLRSPWCSVCTHGPAKPQASFRIKNGACLGLPHRCGHGLSGQALRGMRNTQASRWHLLEPRLRLGLSHLPLGTASPSPECPEDGRRAAGRAESCPRGQEKEAEERGAWCPQGGEGSCWAGGPHSPHAHCPSSLSCVAGRDPRLSCQHRQLQLSLPQPTSILTTLTSNPHPGRHGPSTQMRKRHFRNWPLSPLTQRG